MKTFKEWFEEFTLQDRMNGWQPDTSLAEKAWEAALEAADEAAPSAPQPSSPWKLARLWHGNTAIAIPSAACRQ